MRDGVATIPLLLLFALVTMNWWINVIVAPSIFVLRRPILSAIRRKRASSSFGGAVILVSGVEKIVTSQEDLLVLSMSFPPTSSNLPLCTPMRGTHRFGIKGKLAPRYIGPFKVLAKRGEVAYLLELPEKLSKVHDVFHVSQLKKCFKDPDRAVDHESIDLQEDLTYKEHPVRILDEAERRTRNNSVKFLKVQWSHHSDKEATWECEDQLRSEYPSFFSSS